MTTITICTIEGLSIYKLTKATIEMRRHNRKIETQSDDLRCRQYYRRLVLRIDRKVTISQVTKVTIVHMTKVTMSTI